MSVSAITFTALLIAVGAPQPSEAQQVETARAPESTSQDSVESRYRIRRGDSFDVIFPFVPSFNRTVTVQPDGYIALPVVGEIEVDGQTVPELEATLRRHYAATLREPVITIALKDFEKPYFIASGEVERPGKYELRGETTVAQALAMAGGLKEKAKRSRILLFSGASTGKTEVRELDVKRILNDGRLDSDVKLSPGDMLFVPKSRMPSAALFLPVLSVLPWFFRPF